MAEFFDFLGNNLADFWTYTGFANATVGHLCMILVGLVFIYLAVAKEFEPMLLIPIGFGMPIASPSGDMWVVITTLVDSSTSRYISSNSVRIVVLFLAGEDACVPGLFLLISLKIFAKVHFFFDICKKIRIFAQKLQQNYVQTHFTETIGREPYGREGLWY